MSLEGKSLHIMVPMYGGFNSMNFFNSFHNLVIALIQNQVPYSYNVVWNESLISRARNRLVDDFLKLRQATHTLFCDADIGFEPLEILQMMDIDRDIIGAPCVTKSIRWDRIQRTIKKNGREYSNDELSRIGGNYVFNFAPFEGKREMHTGEPQEVSTLGTGLLMVKRGVWEKFIEEYPDRWYESRGDAAALPGPIHDFFRCGINPENREYESEDYCFCVDAAKIGYKVWMCPWMRTSHMGSYRFPGRLADNREIDRRDLIELRRACRPGGSPLGMGGVCGRNFRRRLNLERGEMAANAIDLTTLLAVKQKAELGVQPTGGTLTIVPTADDNEVQAAISGFSQWLLNRCGVTSLNSIASLDEIYNGNGNNRIMLRSYPIVNVSAVNMFGVGIPASSGQNSWGYFIEQSRKSLALRGGIGNYTTFPYANSNTVYSSNRKGPVFMYGTGNIQVQYNAGYPSQQVTNEIDTITNQTIMLQGLGPWASDGGVVYYPSLVPLTVVPNSPAVGEYAVSNGLYVFNVADNSNQVAVTYDVNMAPFDLEYAVRCVVAINYKRKGWQDQKSRATTSGGTAATTSYRDWAWPTEYENVFQYYQRGAIYA